MSEVERAFRAGWTARGMSDRSTIGRSMSDLDETLERYRLHQAGVSDLDALYWAAARWSEFPTDEDVEVGARAMYERDDAYDLLWSDQSERNGVRDWYRDKVRAAFSAVRARETGGTP